MERVDSKCHDGGCRLVESFCNFVYVAYSDVGKVAEVVDL
jgi:hypothetical protein